MKKHSVFVFLLAVLFGLVSTALAQSYQIRTSVKTNLRTHYSTRSSIAETVTAGTVLQVVGKFNRWLKISRNGSQVWMADWVRHTRIGGATSPAASQPVAQPASQPEAPQQQGQIDNYCFTTWTCATDDDWQKGYHAYQNDLAQGASQSESVGPSPAQSAVGQPVSGSTFYEFLGEQELVTRLVTLTPGTWKVKLTTAAVAIVRISTVDSPGCLDHSTYWVRGWATRWRSVSSIAWKSGNIAGGNNEANGVITVHKTCVVSFYVWAPGHAWSLKLTKS